GSRRNGRGSGAFHTRGCRWRAAPPIWDAGAARWGIEVGSDSMKPALLFGGDCNVFALWSCRPRGPAKNPAKFRRWLHAGWRPFRGLEKRKVWGEEKARPEGASCTRAWSLTNQISV